MATTALAQTLTPTTITPTAHLLTPMDTATIKAIILVEATPQVITLHPFLILVMATKNHSITPSGGIK